MNYVLLATDVMFAEDLFIMGKCVYVLQYTSITRTLFMVLNVTNLYKGTSELRTPL